MTTRWDNRAIEYTEVDALKMALVGRSIVSSFSEGSDYDRVLSFVLDNGKILRAHANDGGCACSNGCFSVDFGNNINGTITNVEVKEFEDYSWSNDYREIEPGSIRDGSSQISIFVYADLGQQLLVQSEGSDNGYYGWGFWLDVIAPEKD